MKPLGEAAERVVRRILPSGTRIYDAHDPRHIGRIDARLWNGDYRVTFDNGLRADIPPQRIRRAAPGN